MSAPAIAPPAETVDQKVARLLEQWRRETAYISSSTIIDSHPAYLAIIALGEPALPSLFRDLANRRDGHLAHALTTITGFQPVPKESFGKGREIADIWLAWAEENGHP
jgi:hypothetical protein